MDKTTFSISGQIVDLLNKRIFGGELWVKDGVIVKITKKENAPNQYILPGFVNAHVHIESSMLNPVQFSKLVLPSGTLAVVSDPHEIVNVCGSDGFDYMYTDAQKTPLKIYFGAPSCVPATPFETSGAMLDSAELEKLIKKYKLKYLSEMMNFPGVIFDDPEVHAKLKIARDLNLAIDGHAPGLKGNDLAKYVAGGITTDHECTSLNEAEEKIKLGMKILIREGSAAKDFEALFPLIDQYPDMVMLCTDDSHPDDLIQGHINLIVKRALQKGLDLFNVLRAASLNAIEHYKLDVGLLQIDDPADFILVDNLESFQIQSVFIHGNPVFDKDTVNFPYSETPIINQFNIEPISIEDIRIRNKNQPLRVIEAYEGSLLTCESLFRFPDRVEFLEADISNDILKMVVVNRYQAEKPQIGFVKNFRLKEGAIASCIAHDSHNIIAVGTSDKDLLLAINQVIFNKGGIAVTDGTTVDALPLPIGGILSNEDGVKVASKYLELQSKTQKLGSTLKAPFMTLSFMALLVIPSLKLGDKGLFDVHHFRLTDLFVSDPPVQEVNATLV